MKIGDIVQLKSGSPLMTISNIIGEKITCSWFDGKNPKDHVFNCNTLEIYKDKEYVNNNKNSLNLWD